jgi:hypothetical protein
MKTPPYTQMETSQLMRREKKVHGGNGCFSSSEKSWKIGEI